MAPRRNSGNRYNDSWDEFGYDDEQGYSSSGQNYENRYDRNTGPSYNSDYDNNNRGNRYHDNSETNYYGASGRYSSGGYSDRYGNDDLEDYFDDVFGRNEYDNENRRYTINERDYYGNSGSRNQDYDSRFGSGSERSRNYGSRSYENNYRDNRDRYNSGSDSDYSGRWPISQSSDRRGVARGYDNHGRRDSGYGDSFYNDEQHWSSRGNQQRDHDRRYSSNYGRSRSEYPNSYHLQSENRNRDNEGKFTSSSSRRSGFGSRITGATNRSNVSNFQNRSESRDKDNSENSSNKSS